MLKQKSLPNFLFCNPKSWELALQIRGLAWITPLQLGQHRYRTDFLFPNIPIYYFISGKLNSEISDSAYGLIIESIENCCVVFALHEINR